VAPVVLDPAVQALADELAAVRGVVAVVLGGSRATGTARADSDWDLGLYYRGTLAVNAIRALGHAGEVFEPGAWGGGLMNGGAWLRLATEASTPTRVDVVYRDLDAVGHCVDEARAGRFWVERLPFYLAGIPSYVPVGELALCVPLFVRDGTTLPRPEYPDTLRASAAAWWHASARLSLDGAEQHHLARGDTVLATGCLVRALVEEAHARLAAGAEWVLNEKGILARAGLDAVPPDATAVRAALA
jgi:predicted nucleotidyltransferase